MLPGDPLKRGALCLTFDDAHYDFYHTVFPLLKQYNLKALLGVPTRYILEKSNLSSEERLSVPYTLAMQDGFFDKKAPFCTWEEIEEMVASGHVQVASHSHAHCNLTFSFVNLQREIIQSKEILEARLKQPVTSFIYPFGRLNGEVHRLVSKHYPYSFRIGSAASFSWDCTRGPISRISADNCGAKELLGAKVKSVALLKGAVAKLLRQT